MDDVPDELSQLRGDWGVSVGSWDEVAINQQMADLVAGILTSAGIVVDVLPATVPEEYKADLFLALHADAFKDPDMSGFMVARSEWSKDPARDDALVKDLIDHYGAATGLPDRQAAVSDNMTEYYAFNYKAYKRAISPETPGVILEMGFLSNYLDREVLTEGQSRVAWGIAAAIMDFFSGKDR